MKTINLVGVLQNTSDKQGDFESKTKSAYISLTPKSLEKAKEFGLPIYESQENGEKFTIVKLSQEVKLYLKGEKTPYEILSGLVNDLPNFDTDDRLVGLSIMEGESKGNKFNRLYAMLTPDKLTVKFAEAQNPFDENTEIDDLPF